MKSALTAFILSFFALGAPALADSVLESFFDCRGENGKAKVFVDSRIFCSNEKVNPAVLLLDIGDQSNLYRGELIRWEDGQGESFFYRQEDQTGRFEISMTLPYGQEEGIYSLSENGEVMDSKKMFCVTKQIHVDCR